VLGENGCGFAREGVVRLESEQRESIPGGAVQRAETAVIVALPPQAVIAAAGA